MKQICSIDGKQKTYEVVDQRSKKHDAMTIQISKVIDLDEIKILSLHHDIAIIEAPASYIYEEIDHNDFVTYARFMDINNIGRNYAWALGKA